MEKYSKFRDPATGIAPFQPNKPADRSWFTVIVQFLIGVVLLPVIFSTLFLGPFLTLFPTLHRLYCRYVLTVSLRLFWVDLSYDGERKASVRKSEIQRAKPGDLIVSNYVSPLDAIIYSGFFNCQFVFPNKGKFIPVSYIGTVLQALSLDLVSGKGQPIDKIVSKAKEQGCVVVLFGEGTTSNGKGVLSLKNVDWQPIAPLKTHVFASAVKYTPNIACSPIGGTFFGYIYSLQTRLYWCMAAVHISKQLDTAARTQLGASKELSLSCRCRMVGDDLDITAKRDFYHKLRTKK